MNTVVRNFAPVKKFNAFPTFFEGLLNELETLPTKTLQQTLPSVNIIEKEDSFHIELAAPGLKNEDFKVNVHENVLTISVEKKEETNEEKDNYTRKEFNYTSFKRSFTLPKTVDSDKIEATYTDGILQLTLPKKEEAKPKEPKLITVA